MIDIHSERLLPTKELPGYLQSRGYGKRVTMTTVYRWIGRGCRGVRLEVVRVGGTLLTSLEAVQRWVEGQSQDLRAREQKQTSPAAATRTRGRSKAEALREASTDRILIENRIKPTELDGLLAIVPGGTPTTRAHVAGLLFRAGFRKPEALSAAALETVLELPRVGKASENLIRKLHAAARHGG